MIPNTYVFPTGAAPLYAAILEEIASQNWSQPAQITVDELGLVMGTHVGLKRTRNEDRLVVARTNAPNSETYTVALVCDGVGGSELGDQAATLAISSVICQLALQNSRTPLKELATILVRRADDHVRQELKGRGATTLVMVLATTNGLMVCAAVGDSRAYSWDPRVGELNQLTVDDTMENELKDVPGNHTALLQARGLQGRLSQAIGEMGRTSEELRVQTRSRESFPRGVLLGSDGLWRAAKDFESIAAGSKTAIDLVRRTINLANWVGGVDNSSVIAIEDLEYFYQSQVEAKNRSNPNPSITLWTPFSKVRILFRDWHSAPEAMPNRPNLEKIKKKPVRGKSTVKKSPDPQLPLETESFGENRPKLEITISEKLKKSE